MIENSEQPLKILSGVKILSLTQWLVGPAAVQYLADLGADVTKVEPPIVGTWERRWAGADSFRDGVSIFYMLSHRNVRSVTVNLKHPDGVQIIKDLIKHSDVMVQNFRPGVLERLGLGYDEARELNPSMVYASASGYGEGGPYQDLPGQDLLAQALTGLAAISGRKGELPTPTGSAIVDQHCAALLAFAIVAALFHRELTGEGQKVETTLIQAALDLQLEPAVYYLNGAEIDRPRAGLASSFHPAPYGIYETADGYLVLSLTPIKVLREALDSPLELAEYEDAGLAFAQRERIREILDPVFRTRPTADWIDSLRSRGVWCAPVNDYDRTFADPGVRYLDPILEIDHPRVGKIRVLKLPASFSSGIPELSRVPPELGEHTDEVLRELGYSFGEIRRLEDTGAI